MLHLLRWNALQRICCKSNKCNKRIHSLHDDHGPGVGEICMDIDALLLLLFKRFSAVSQTKYNFFFQFFEI